MNTSPQLDSESHKNLLSHFKRDIVFFDLETTGLSPANNYIIEIGAIKLAQTGEISSFHSLIKPPIAIPLASKKIHGISDDDVFHSPLIKTAMPLFFNFIKDCDLIAHNAMFDLGFIIQEAKNHQLKLPIVDVYDSLNFTRKILSKQEKKPKNFKLSTLAKFVNFSHKAHRAYDDALATVYIWSGTLNKATGAKEISEAHLKSQVFTTQKIKSYNENHQTFELLSQLANKQQNTIIVYNAGSRRGKERPIRPIALIPLPHKVSLYAYCYLDQAHKNFTLNKIKYARAFTKHEETLYGT